MYNIVLLAHNGIVKTPQSPRTLALKGFILIGYRDGYQV